MKCPVIAIYAFTLLSPEDALTTTYPVARLLGVDPHHIRCKRGLGWHTALPTAHHAYHAHRTTHSTPCTPHCMHTALPLAHHAPYQHRCSH